MEPTAVVDASTYMPPMSSTHMHMKMKPMWMWFHSTVNDVVLFESWTVTTPGDMVWSCLAVMAMGVLLEFVRYARWRFEIGHTKDAFLNTKYATFTVKPARSYMTRLFSLTHILQTVMFAVQLIISYFLMLVFMTFSIWLGIAVCVGAETTRYQPGIMMMKMYFHFRVQEPILFREWMALDLAGYVFSCIGVALIAAFYEVVKLGRLGIERTVNEQHLCGCDSNSASLHSSKVAPGMPCGVTDENRKTEPPFIASNLKRSSHVLSSAIYFVQMFIAYALMMISMTYNVPIFLSLILGHTLAYFLLGPLVSVGEYEKLGDCCA